MKRRKLKIRENIEIEAERGEKIENTERSKK